MGRIKEHLLSGAQSMIRFWCPGINKTLEVDPDSEWKEQQKDQETNPIYKLATLGVSTQVDMEKISRRLANLQLKHNMYDICVLFVCVPL